MKADISFHFDEFFIILTWSLGRLLAARCSAEVDDLQRADNERSQVNQQLI